MKFKIWLILLLSCTVAFGYGQLEYVSNDTFNYTKLMFVGDIPMNNDLLESAYDPVLDQYDFDDLFYYIKPILNLGDIVCGNLEATIGEPPYSRYPTYKVPESFGNALKLAGFNLMMTANSKAVYQEYEDWVFHKEALNKVGIQQIGSFEDEDDSYKRNPLIIEKNGIKTAFLNYMAGIDYVPEISPIVNAGVKENIESDIIMAKNRGAEFIVVYFNWGKEFQSYANVGQQELAFFSREAGANLVLGSHPHIVQGFEIEEKFSNNEKVKSLTAFSMGDFYSTTQSTEVNGSYILEVILCKDKRNKTTKICDYGYIPTFTYQATEIDKISYHILPVSQIEKGNISSDISSEEYSALRASAERVRYKMGSDIEEVVYELDDAIVADVAEVLKVTKRPLNESKNFKLNPNELQLASTGFMEESNMSVEPVSNRGIVYRVQFLTLKNNIAVDLRYYTHLAGYEVVKEDGYFKYLIGNLRSLKEANDLCLDIKRLGHSKAFVVVYKDGERINL